MTDRSDEACSPPADRPPTTGERPTLVIPGFLTLVIVGCVAMGLAIFWLLRSMHI